MSALNLAKFMESPSTPYRLPYFIQEFSLLIKAPAEIKVFIDWCPRS